MEILEYNIYYVGKHAERICMLTLYKVRGDVRWSKMTS